MWLATLYTCALTLSVLQPCGATTALKIETRTIKAESKQDCEKRAYSRFDIPAQLKPDRRREIVCVPLQS